jgi:hypothetical protein
MSTTLKKKYQVMIGDYFLTMIEIRTPTKRVHPVRLSRVAPLSPFRLDQH